MVDLAGFARFQHDADPRALLVADEMVMDGSARQERTDRNAIFVAGAVRKDDQAVARVDRLARPRGKCGRAPASSRQSPPERGYVMSIVLVFQPR